jgi:hypothetical protein
MIRELILNGLLGDLQFLNLAKDMNGVLGVLYLVDLKSILRLLKNGEIGVLDQNLQEEDTKLSQVLKVLVE